MEEGKTSKPRFLLLRRFGTFLNVVLSAVALLAILGMLNYLASGYYERFELSRNARWQLSPQTKKIVQSLTNEVNATIFFDASDPEYEDLHEWVVGLLKEYRNLNGNIKVRNIDPTRSPGEAASVLAKFKLDPREKNFVLFDTAAPQTYSQVVYANRLLDRELEQVSKEKLEFTRRTTAFRGEMLFTAAIFSITHPRPLKAYFLAGHGEYDPDDNASKNGYGKFASVLKEECNVDWQKLTLRSTNEIPDCQLVVIAGPTKAQFSATEISAIENYLAKGGRLLVLLNNLGLGVNSGIERVLAKWGVKAGNDIVFDKDFAVSGNDLIAAEVNPKHPVTKTLYTDDLKFYVVQPRSLEKVADLPQTADAPKVEFLFRTSTNGVSRTPVKIGGTTEFDDQTGSYGIAAAIEQGTIKGVTAERGATRVIVIGDSICFNNYTIDSVANRAFANFAVNWLLAQPSVLLEGIGPRPIQEYSMKLTPRQRQNVSWILVGGMPAAVLFLGTLVWLRRRS